MEYNPLALFGDKCSFNPIFSMNETSDFIISSGVLLLKTINKIAIIPFVIIASLSAIKLILQSLKSAFNQTLILQTFIKF